MGGWDLMTRVAVVMTLVAVSLAGSFSDHATAASDKDPDNSVAQGPVVSLEELLELPAPEGPVTPPPHLPEPSSVDRVIDASPIEGVIEAVPDDFSPQAPFPSASSPVPTSSFQAILSNQQTFPPDTNGAVGTNHLMVVLNSEFQYQTKSGSVIEKISIEQFWSPLQGGAQDQVCTRTDFDVFDPKIIYDSEAQRWVVTSIFCRRDPGSGVFLAVSKTADPTGDWTYYSIDADGSDTEWADFPSLGVTGKWIIVSYNMFPNADGTFTESQIGVFEKARAYDETLTSFTRETDPGFTLVPANAPDNTGDAYLVGSWASSVGCLRVTKITGSASSPAYSNASPVFPGWDGSKCSAAWSSHASAANPSPQLGGSSINAGDHRMQTCTLKEGAIWCAHTVFLPAATGERGAAQWWQFTPAGNILQRGRIEDTSGKYHYTYPSLAVNSTGDVLIGFSRFASSEYPSAGYAYRAAGDSPNTMRPDRIYRPGQAPYASDLDPSGRLRWGDYSASQVDPTDDEVFWTIQEFSSQHVASRNWGTWWAEVDTTASTADTSPPTWPSSASLSATATSQTEASLSWTAAEDNVGVTAYGVYINGSLKGTVTGRSATVTGLEFGKTYKFKVEARDQAGNWSTDGPSAQLSVDDSQAPTWPDLSFRADVFERDLTLHWDAAKDDVGVVGYVVVQAPGEPVDGVYHGNVVAELGKSARSYRATGLLPATSYAFWVEAFDSAGNMSEDGPLRVFTTATDFGDTNGHTFHDDIAWLAGAGVTKGCNPPDNDRFCPDDFVTRAQMASFLVRALGLTGGEGSDFFIDDNDSVHETDIDRLAFWEITLGCNPSSVPANTRYCPEDPVTRAQMGSFLTRALLLADGWNIDYFEDDDFSVHEFDINRLAHSGITKGCNPPLNSLFCPTDLVTRGQMAAFVHRAEGEINAVRDLLKQPLLGLKNDAASESVPLSR